MDILYFQYSSSKKVLIVSFVAGSCKIFALSQDFVKYDCLTCSYILQCDNKVAAQLLESILFIMDSVLPLLRKVPMSILEELEQDLKHMIVRHSFLAVVHACIKYIASLLIMFIVSLR